HRAAGGGRGAGGGVHRRRAAPHLARHRGHPQPCHRHGRVPPDERDLDGRGDGRPVGRARDLHRRGTDPMTRTIRRLLPLAALAAGLAALGLGAAPPAAAHEGEAVIAVETVEPTDLSVRYVVRVTWSNDGHPATDAVVTATAVAPDGTQTTPVTMTPIDADGRYEGTVEHPAPGAWTVRFTVVEPPGRLAHPVELAAPAPTTTAAPTTEAPTTEAPAGDAGAGGAEEPAAAADEAAAEDADDDGGSGMAVGLIAAAAVVAVVGAVAAVRLARRRGGPTASGEDHGPAEGAEGPSGEPADEAAAGPGARPAS